jgi:hypothetical protein
MANKTGLAWCAGDLVHLTHVAQLPRDGGCVRTICIGPPAVYSEDTEDREVRASVGALPSRTVDGMALTRCKP